MIKSATPQPCEQGLDAPQVLVEQEVRVIRLRSVTPPRRPLPQPDAPQAALSSAASGQRGSPSACRRPPSCGPQRVSAACRREPSPLCPRSASPDDPTAGRLTAAPRLPRSFSRIRFIPRRQQDIAAAVSLRPTVASPRSICSPPWQCRQPPCVSLAAPASPA